MNGRTTIWLKKNERQRKQKKGREEKGVTERQGKEKVTRSGKRKSHTSGKNCGRRRARPAPPRRQGRCWPLCGPREVPGGGASGGRGEVGTEKMEPGGARRLPEGALKHTVARSAASEGRRVWSGHTAAQPQRPSDLEDRSSGRPRRG